MVTRRYDISRILGCESDFSAAAVAQNGGASRYPGTQLPKQLLPALKSFPSISIILEFGVATSLRRSGKRPTSSCPQDAIDSLPSIRKISEFLESTLK